MNVPLQNEQKLCEFVKLKKGHRCELANWLEFVKEVYRGEVFFYNEVLKNQIVFQELQATLKLECETRDGVIEATLNS